MSMIYLGVIIGGLFGVICYIATANIISSLLVAGITIIYFSFFVKKQVASYSLKIERFHSCYQFINNFIVSLSIKGSLTSALDSTKATLNDEMDEVLISIEKLSIEEKLKYLGKYYRFHIYNLFLDLVSLWSEQGGDIVKMSHYLTNQSREIEEYIVACQTIHKKRIVEFAILWLFSIAIIIVLRFALSQFFEYIVKQVFYQASIVVVFLFILVSIQLVINKMTKVDIEGWDEHEK